MGSEFRLVFGYFEKMTSVPIHDVFGRYLVAFTNKRDHPPPLLKLSSLKFPEAYWFSSKLKSRTSLRGPGNDLVNLLPVIFESLSSNSRQSFLRFLSWRHLSDHVANCYHIKSLKHDP